MTGVEKGKSGSLTQGKKKTFRERLPKSQKLTGTKEKGARDKR